MGAQKENVSGVNLEERRTGGLESSADSLIHRFGCGRWALTGAISQNNNMASPYCLGFFTHGGRVAGMNIAHEINRGREINALPLKFLRHFTLVSGLGQSKAHLGRKDSIIFHLLMNTDNISQKPMGVLRIF